MTGSSESKRRASCISATVAAFVLFCGFVRAEEHNTDRWGYIHDWLILGPFRYEPFPSRHGVSGGEIDYERMQSEHRLDPTEHHYLGDDGAALPRPGDTFNKRRWIAHHNEGLVVNVEKLLAKHMPSASEEEEAPKGKKGTGPLDFYAAYAVTYVYCDREIRNATMYIGSDDLNRVYLNGVRVHTFKAKRRCHDPPDEVTGLTLRKGWNVLTVKIVEIKAGCTFYVALLDDNDQYLAGVPVSLSPPVENAVLAEKGRERLEEEVTAPMDGIARSVFDVPEGTPEEGWQDGDYAEVLYPVVQTGGRRLKFWPWIEFPCSTLATPQKMNMLENRGANGGLGHITPYLGRAPATQTGVSERFLNAHKVLSTVPVSGSTIRFTSWKSDLSPALLVKANSSQVAFFEGLGEVGLGGPTRAAFANGAGRGVRIEPLENGASLDIGKAMTENWLLVWFHGSKNWKAVDAPYLILLQNRPSGVRVEDGVLVFSFPGEAGYVAGMILRGAKRITPADTAGWGRGLPQDVVDACRFWSRALRNYPVAVRDTFAIDEAADRIRVRLTFQYIPIRTQWDAAGADLPKPFAVLPNWLALAARQNTGAVVLPDDYFETGCHTDTGPFAGVWGHTIEYAFVGQMKYIRQDLVATGIDTSTEAYKVLYGDLEKHFDLRVKNLKACVDGWERQNLRQQIRKNGLVAFGQHNIECDSFVLVGMSQALPYMPEELQREAGVVMGRYMQYALDMNRYEGFPVFRGKKTRSTGLIDMEWFVDRFLWACWSYAHATGDWEKIRESWPLIRAEFRDKHWGPNLPLRWRTGSGVSREYSSRPYAVMGYARMARKMGDTQAFRYASYLAVRSWMRMVGTWQQIRYLPDKWYRRYREKMSWDEAPVEPKRVYWINWHVPYFRPEIGLKETDGPLEFFYYGYGPTIPRFLRETAPDYLGYCFDNIRQYHPDWYKADGIDRYRKDPRCPGPQPYDIEGQGMADLFAVLAWQNDFFGEEFDSLYERYRQSYFKSDALKGFWRGRAMFVVGNHGWTSVLQALTAMVQTAGKKEWVDLY